MKLLMVGPALDVRGGVSSVERLILESLPSHIQATHISTMREGSKAKKAWVFLVAMVAIGRELLGEVDLVHVHFSSGASSARKNIVAVAAMTFGKKVIMHAHGSEYREYWQELSGPARARSLRILQRAAAIIVLGDSWRDFFVSIGVPASQLCVIPNPVRLPPQVPARDDRSLVRLLFLGIIDHRKGAFDLVEAFRSLPLAVRDRCKLVVAGNGEVEKLRDLVARHSLGDSITVKNWVTSSERDILLAESDAFVLPSRNEGLPMAMLEAMAWGLPVVCTPVGSIPEVIRDGVNGLLVPPGDISEISGAIARLVLNESERLSMGRAARDSVAPLSVQFYMEKLQSLYDAALT